MHTNFSSPQGYLSEEDVTRFFFPYLKEFYRYRYEYKPSSVDARTAQVSLDGIRADGVLSFTKEDGTPFICAFEATGREVIDEVKYKMNTTFFIWDCITFSLIFTAISYSILFFTQFAFLKNLGWVGNFGFIAGCLIFFYSAWYFLMQNWQKYRYIYAVEQFKQYYADEQWVAIAADVFPGRDDPYMAELKNQCMYNGFGLVVVEVSGEVLPIATPSHLGPYGKDRRMRTWLTDTELYKTIQESSQITKRIPKGPMAILDKIWRPINQYVVKPIKKNVFGLVTRPFQSGNSAFSKYMKSYAYQKYLSGAALLILVFMAGRAIQFRTVEFVDEEQYSYDLKNKPYRDNPEHEEGIVIDGQPWYKQKGVPRQYPEDEADYSDEEINYRPAEIQPQMASTEQKPKSPTRQAKTTVREIDLNPIEKTPKPTLYASAEIQKNTPKSSVAKAAPRLKAIVAPKLSNACDFLAQNKGWIIQDNYFSTMEYAKERQEELRQRGYETFIVPKNCKNTEEDGYWVFVKKIYKEQEEAEKAIKTYRKALDRYSLNGNKAFLKKI